VRGRYTPLGWNPTGYGAALGGGGLRGDNESSRGAGDDAEEPADDWGFDGIEGAREDDAVCGRDSGICRLEEGKGDSSRNGDIAGVVGAVDGASLGVVGSDITDAARACPGCVRVDGVSTGLDLSGTRRKVVFFWRFSGALPFDLLPSGDVGVIGSVDGESNDGLCS